MLYRSLNWVESRLGYATKAKPVDKVGFRRVHEFGARYLLNLPIVIVPSGISEGKQNATD
jgi:hypothetical protein